MLSFGWGSKGSINTGVLCNAQGKYMHASICYGCHNFKNVSQEASNKLETLQHLSGKIYSLRRKLSAYTAHFRTSIFAIHIFHILFLRVRATKTIFLAALVSGWGIVLILSVIGPLVLQKKGPYFSIVGGL